MGIRIGLLARCDKSGLAYQTQRIARLIEPDKIMLIDSTPFNANKQYPELYKDYNSLTINGLPNDMEIRHFLSGLDIVITCETFYSLRFTEIARSMNVKTIIISNPEFMDWFKPNWAFIPLPDKVLVPSQWMAREMTRFNAEYLPTPIFEDEFKKARRANLKRSGKKYLFINGKTAIHDRNGLESLYEAVQLAKGKFTITIKAQNDIKKHPDPRLIYDFSNPDNPEDLYKGFDALILPRRYGGQTLAMIEGLQSALPVIMTDIDPNNRFLPIKWLVEAEKIGEFIARTKIDIYSANPIELAIVLDSLDTSKEAKEKAYNIGRQFDAEKLRSKYEELVK